VGGDGQAETSAHSIRSPALPGHPKRLQTTLQQPEASQVGLNIQCRRTGALYFAVSDKTKQTGKPVENLPIQTEIMVLTLGACVVLCRAGFVLPVCVGGLLTR
jgi:hypothetical protein